jgi:16S rRNA U516 pseudouridylate synthase RsuA-like enzyme
MPGRRVPPRTRAVEARNQLPLRHDPVTTGVLLLTTDTQLAHRLTDPSSAIVRRCVSTVRSRLAASLGDLPAGQWRTISKDELRRAVGVAAAVSSR